MEASDRIEFEPVIAGCPSIHCYLDGYYVARIALHADGCDLDGPLFRKGCRVEREEEARELVRMAVRRRS